MLFFYGNKGGIILILDPAVWDTSAFSLLTCANRVIFMCRGLKVS